MKTIQLILLFILAVPAFAQEAVSASGGTVNDVSGSFSFTVGQPMYGYTQNSANSVSEGVQQTIKVNSLSTEQFGFEDGLVVYPNPVIDNVTITYTDVISSVEVINLLGQRVLTARPADTSATIDMNGLSPGTYLLMIESEGKTSTVKVIKNQ